MFHVKRFGPIPLKRTQGLIRQTALSEEGLRGKVVFLQFDGAAVRGADASDNRQGVVDLRLRA
jgi:hypothetical protein